MLDRRAFLKTTAAGAALAATLPQAPAYAAADPFMKLDATAQAALVRKGEASAAELIDAAIARIEALNPALNAVVAKAYDQAKEIAEAGAPDGPFQGVPFLIKDLSDQENVRTSFGSKFFAGNIAKQSSTTTASQLALGLISLGKSNTPEFGFLPTTESLQLGPCRNPWNTAHSSGGSSGGAAAAVASGMVPIASASDGGGSIRIPASCCGLLGLKTSRGRTIDDDRYFSLISVRHLVSRSVRDTATFLHGVQAKNDLPPVPLLTGHSGRKLKIAFSLQNALGAAPDPDVAAAIEATAKLCESLGHEVEEARIDYDGEAFVESFLTFWASGAKRITTQATELSGGKNLRDAGVFEPFTWGLVDFFDAQPKEKLEQARAHFAELAAKTKAHHARFDATLTPVLASPPPKIGALAPTVPFQELRKKALDYVSYTPLANATGEPAISVPLGWSSDGLPIGSHFQTGVGREALLLELAYQLEEAAPWADKWPALSARL